MHSQCLELLKDHLSPGSVALDIGSGSGYLAACMGEMVKPNGKVFGVEHIAELNNIAVNNMKKTNPDLLHHTIELVVGDGRLGLPQHAPFDWWARLQPAPLLAIAAFIVTLLCP